MNNRPENGGGLAIRRSIVVALLWCAACAMLPAQDSPGNDDLNGLFNDGGDTSTTPPADSGETGTPAVRSDDLTQDRTIHAFGTLDIYGLTGIGWPMLPYSRETSNDFGYEVSGSLTATLGIEIRPAPELRLRGTMSYNFPKSGTQLSELIVDYSIRHSVFLRIGIFDYTWGNSQFFQFSNLPVRSLPDWGISNEPLWQKTNILEKNVDTDLPVSVKINIPLGLHNLTLLSRFDMENYGFPDVLTPTPKDAGYGMKFDLVTGPVEWSIAGFYQHLLNPRTSLGMKTSIMGFDLSTETTLAFPVNLSPDGITWNPTDGGGIPVGSGRKIYSTVVASLAREWTDSRIKLYAEYAFNGERDPGVSWLEDEAGPGGHNSAVVVRFRRFLDSVFSLNVVWQQNWSDGSGLVSPLLEFSPEHLTTCQFGPVFAYGSEDSEVSGNRLVPGDMQLEFLLLLKISASFRQ